MLCEETSTDWQHSSVPDCFVFYKLRRALSIKWPQIAFVNLLQKFGTFYETFYIKGERMAQLLFTNFLSTLDAISG